MLTTEERLKIVEGIIPVRLFCARFNRFRSTRLSSFGGISPTKRICKKLTFNKYSMKEKELIQK